MTRKLDRLKPGVNDKGIAFQNLWQRNCELSEANFDDLQTQITGLANVQAQLQAQLTQIQAAQAAANAAQSTADTATTKANTAQSTANTATTKADTAQSAADTANTAAGAAQSTADTVKRDNALSASWTSPGSILEASDAGTDTTVTILAHDRHYDDREVTAGISGGNIVGIAYGTTVYVYYDDPGRSDTTPTYHAVTNPKTAAYNVAAGRHYCGSVTTPSAGGGTSSGGTIPPGGGYDGPGAIP